MSDKKLNFVESVLFRCFLNMLIKIKIDNKLRFWNKNYAKVHTILSPEELPISDGFKLSVYPRISMKFLWKYYPDSIKEIEQFDNETITIINKKDVDRLKRNNIKLKFNMGYRLNEKGVIINVFCKKDKVYKLKLMGIFDQ